MRLAREALLGVLVLAFHADARPPAGADATLPPQIVKSAAARVRAAESAEELNRMLSNLRPGDVIEIAPGTYRDLQIHLPPGVRGSGSEPIVIRAAKPHAVILTGESYIHVEAQHVTIEGLAFVDNCMPQGKLRANFAACIYLGAKNNRVTSCRFERCGDPGEKAWRHLVHIPRAASDNRVDANIFLGSLSIPTGLQSGDGPQRNAFTHNTIDGNDARAPKNYRVAIQIGQGGTAGERTETLVEYNTIRNFVGPGSIELKSSNCIVRNNLVIDSDAPLGVRAGNDNRILSNVMLRCSGGIMVTGRGHKIEGNHVHLGGNGGLGAIFLMHEAWRDGEVFYQLTTECTIRDNRFIVAKPNRASPAMHAFAWLPDVRSVPRGNTVEGNLFVSYTGGPPLIDLWDQAHKETTVEQFVAANRFRNNRFWTVGATTPDEIRVPGEILGKDGNRAEAVSDLEDLLSPDAN